MNTVYGRQIYSCAESTEIRNLLQLIFASELIRPSRILWLVSPWISDIPILDNRTAGFSALEPNWPCDMIRLSQVLLHLYESGATIHIATRPLDVNRPLLQRLRDALPREQTRLQVHQVEELHAKGILGDGYFLSGSMNLTHNGISIAEECVHYLTDPQAVAENRLKMRDRWGGEC